MADTETLVTLTADIVSAHLSNNRVSVNDVPALIQNVHGALAGLNAEKAPEAPAKPEPIVSVRSSVKPDSVTCLICGKPQKMLKRHLMTNHGLTPSEYRDTFDLRADYPMVAPNYAESRRQLAHKIGLGRKGRITRPANDKTGNGRAAGTDAGNGASAGGKGGRGRGRAK